MDFPEDYYKYNYNYWALKLNKEYWNLYSSLTNKCTIY